MKKIAFNRLCYMQLLRVVLLICLSILTGCGDMDCLDKKTGMHQASPTLQFSKENSLFSFNMKPDKTVIKLDDGYSFQIKNAWVESRWAYECIDHKAVIQKDSLLQFVVDNDYKGDAHGVNYRLMESTFWEGGDLGGWSLIYRGQTAIKLWVVKENQIIDSIHFTK